MVLRALPLLGLAAVLLMGCAHRAAPRDTLAQARAVLDEAQHQASADPNAVAEARAAVEYAEQEMRRSPDHPLNAHRAQVAMDEALHARESQRASAPMRREVGPVVVRR